MQPSMTVVAGELENYAQRLQAYKNEVRTLDESPMHDDAYGVFGKAFAQAVEKNQQAVNRDIQILLDGIEEFRVDLKKAGHTAEQADQDGGQMLNASRELQ